MNHSTPKTEIEGLVSDHARRDKLPSSQRDFIKPPAPPIFDEIDLEAASEPILDRLPQRRHSKGSGRIFAILDSLEKGGSR